MLTVGSLFSGIGGLELGLERAGMRCVWQCEIDPYCQRVLARHWPDVLRLRDVRGVNAGTVPPVDVLCGGFPCQDFSQAGKGAGLAGARSGLWFEYARVIRELRPSYVIVENVRNLIARGLDGVLGSLAEIGYDAEWDCIPAAAFGAPHPRDRIWLVAYPQRGELREQSRRLSGAHGEGPALLAVDGPPWFVADAAGLEAGGSHAQADAVSAGGQARPVPGGGGQRGGGGGWASPWAAEPDVGRVADGVPDGVDRLHALGNALLPQIAEWVGRRIVQYEGGVT